MDCENEELDVAFDSETEMLFALDFDVLALSVSFVFETEVLDEYDAEPDAEEVTPDFVKLLVAVLRALSVYRCAWPLPQRE